MTSSQQQHQQKSHGFNLIESAIVLGIIGAIVALIWISTDSVYETSKKKQINEQLLRIIQNTRALYAALPDIGNAAPANLTSAIAAVVMSNDMLFVNPPAASADTINPWYSNGGGNITIIAPVANATSFIIGFGSLPRNSCVDLIAKSGSFLPNAGLTSISVNSKAVASYIPITAVSASGLTAATPYTPVNAALVCNGAFNDVYFTLTLK